MTRQLDFHFSLLSTYTYLAVNRADEVAARAGVTLRWRPFNVRSIMREQNNSPFIGKPVKMKYMWRDLERRARRHGIPFKSIPTYPVDPEMLANRIAVVAALEGWCPQYAKETYRDWFLEDRIPGDVPNTRAILSRLGKDPDGVIARAESAEIKEYLEAETAYVKELGVFGSPTFACGNEIFWGDDRLEDAIEWCTTNS